MSERNCLAIVLAAGEGTRMRSAHPKVLHEVAGRSLLAHVLSAVAAADIARTAVVVGPGADAVTADARAAAAKRAACSAPFSPTRIVATPTPAGICMIALPTLTRLVRAATHAIGVTASLP